MKFYTWLSLALLPAIAQPLTAQQTHHVYPGGSIGNAITQASPGSTIIVHSFGGNESGRYGPFKLWGASGDDPFTPEEEWITVKAAPGEPRPGIYYAGNDQNLMEIYYFFRYIKLLGLGFEGGSDAIKFQTGADGEHIVFEDLRMHHLDNTGINLSSCGDVGYMEIRYCEIFDTGINGHGEGMYLGTHGYQGDGSGILHDSVIEWNHVYDCGLYAHANQQGDGIELKYECYRNIVQDNIIHDTNYPGILSHGTALSDAADNNILRRNAIWNCATEAIQTHQTTTIMNNVVFNSNRCIYVAQNTSNSGILRDVYIHNNTFFTAGYRVARFDVSGKSGIEICNNLFYQPSAGATAVYFNGMAGVTATDNYYYGTSNASFGFSAGPPPASAFINNSTAPGAINLYLQRGSILEGAGSNTYAPPVDFNDTSRPQGGIVEPGAYEILTPDENPGWQIDEEFKEFGTAPWPFGDLNHDGNVDLEDHAVLVEQLTGPTPPTAYYEKGGSVTVEAEHYFSKTDGSGQAQGSAWIELTGDGSLGDGYVQALPDVGLRIDEPDIESDAPHLSYLIYFRTTGPHYLWLRGWAVGGDNADSVHFGLDGVAVSSNFNDSAAIAKTGGFAWTSRCSDGSRTTINVPSPGLHTVDLWMREDGPRIDRLLVTIHTPGSIGEPAESDLQPYLTADLDDDGDCDLVDAAILAGLLQ